MIPLCGHHASHLISLISCIKYWVHYNCSSIAIGLGHRLISFIHISAPTVLHRDSIAEANLVWHRSNTVAYLRTTTQSQLSYDMAIGHIYGFLSEECVDDPRWIDVVNRSIRLWFLHNPSRIIFMILSINLNSGTMCCLSQQFRLAHERVPGNFTAIRKPN